MIAASLVVGDSLLPWGFLARAELPFLEPLLALAKFQRQQARGKLKSITSHAAETIKRSIEDSKGAAAATPLRVVMCMPSPQRCARRVLCLRCCFGLACLLACLLVTCACRTQRLLWKSRSPSLRGSARRRWLGYSVRSWRDRAPSRQVGCGAAVLPAFPVCASSSLCALVGVPGAVESGEEYNSKVRLHRLPNNGGYISLVRPSGRSGFDFGPTNRLLRVTISFTTFVVWSCRSFTCCLVLGRSTPCGSPRALTGAVHLSAEQGRAAKG